MFRKTCVATFTVLGVAGAAACADVLGLSDLRFEEVRCSGAACIDGGGGTGGSAGAGGTAGEGNAPCAQIEELTPPPLTTGFCAGYVANPCSFDEFRAAVVADSAETGMAEGSFVVDGDLLLSSEQELREYYDEVIAQGSQPAVKDKLPLGRRRFLRYCVASSLIKQGGPFPGAMFAATAAWEQLADVHFEYDPDLNDNCGAASEVAFRVEGLSSATIPPALLFSRTGGSVPSIQVSDQALERTAMPDLHSRLRHALGHVLGFGHNRALIDPADCEGEQECRQHEAYRRASIMRRSWCSDAGSVRLFPSQADADALSAAYDAPIEILDFDGGVATRDLFEGRVRKMTSTSDGKHVWPEIGPASRAIATALGTLYRLGRQGEVERYDGEGMWTPVGERAASIFGCDDTLCATAMVTGALIRWSGTEWTQIGEPARRYAATPTELVRITNAGEVQTHSDTWESIRQGQGGRLFTGPGGIYVTNPERRDPNDNPMDRLERWMGGDRPWAQCSPVSGVEDGDYVSTTVGIIHVNMVDRKGWVAPPDCTGTYTDIGTADMRYSNGGEHLYRVELNGTIWIYDLDDAWEGRGIAGREP